MGMLLGASIKMVVRDRQSLFWALIFPLIFLAIFRMFSFDDLDRTDLLVVADESLPVQATLVTALRGVDFLDVEVRAGVDEAAALVAFEEEGFDAALFVAASGAPGGSVDALLLNAVNDPIGHAVTEGAIASVVDDVNATLVNAPRVIAFEARAAKVEVESYFEFLAPGIIGMGLMTFGVIGLAASLSRYREEGVLRRVRATPLAPWKFSASVVMAHLLVAVAQVVVLIGIAYALGANLVNSGLAGFLLVSLLGTFVFLNLGAIVAGRVQGRGAVESVANGITMPMMFLSGSFFPTSGLPQPVQWFVELLPLTHMLRALRSIGLDHQQIWEQGPELAVLMAWAVGTFLLARATFRFQDA
jgi:ABC-2 type transport system permease protein